MAITAADQRILLSCPTHAQILRGERFEFIYGLNFEMMIGQTNVDGLFLVGLLGLLVESLKLLAVLLAPFIAFALVIHWLERATQVRMAERFGWRSVLWTGWLGTPVHELSHAILCPVFCHRIEKMALFEPDKKNRRLGYVIHVYTPGNWYQELGNFFIGVAPLVGGSLTLSFFLWMFYPDAVTAAFSVAADAKNAAPWETMYQITAACFSQVASSTNLLSGRFWLFCYLVLCVGSHMAPSPSDYEGASRGVIFVIGGLLVVAFVSALLKLSPMTLLEGMIALLGPLFAVFGFAVILCSLMTLLVWGVTSLFPKRYSVAG